MKASFAVKNPRSPSLLVFTTATSAARSRALRALVPVATSVDDSLVYVADYETGKVSSYKRRK